MAFVEERRTNVTRGERCRSGEMRGTDARNYQGPDFPDTLAALIGHYEMYREQRSARSTCLGRRLS